MTAISNLQFKYRTAALNTLILHPFLISLPACHSQESQRENPEAKCLYNMRITSACAPCHAKEHEQRKLPVGPRYKTLVCALLCDSAHCGCLTLYFTTQPEGTKGSKPSYILLPRSTTLLHFSLLSSSKNLIIKVPRHQMMEAHSKAAPQNVPEPLACKHPERVTGTKRCRQLYSVQNFLLSTATFSLGMGTEQGRKCQL